MSAIFRRNKADKSKYFVMASMLLEAVTLGRLYQVKFFLDNGADVNVQDEKKQTPLIRACLMDDKLKKSRLSMVKMLLSKQDLDINCADKTGKSAFIWASFLNLEDIVKIFLERCFHRINLYLGDAKGNTALHYACSQGNSNIVQNIVQSYKKYGLEIDKRNNYGHTALLEAVLHKRIVNAMILLEECNACLSVCDSENLMSISEWVQFLQLEPLYCLINRRTGAAFYYSQKSAARIEEHLTVSPIPLSGGDRDRVSPVLVRTQDRVLINTQPNTQSLVTPTSLTPRSNNESERSLCSPRSTTSYSRKHAVHKNDHTRPFLKDSSWVNGGCATESYNTTVGDRSPRNGIKTNSTTPQKQGAYSMHVYGNNHTTPARSPRSYSGGQSRLLNNKTITVNNSWHTHNIPSQQFFLNEPEQRNQTFPKSPRESSHGRRRDASCITEGSNKTFQQDNNTTKGVHTKSLEQSNGEGNKTFPHLNTRELQKECGQKSTQTISSVLGKLLDLSIAYNSPSYRRWKQPAEFIHTGEVCEILEAWRQNEDLMECRSRKGRRRSSRSDIPQGLSRRTSTVERGGMMRRTSSIDKSKVPSILQRRGSITGSSDSPGSQRKQSVRRNSEGITESEHQTSNTQRTKLSALVE